MMMKYNRYEKVHYMVSEMYRGEITVDVYFCVNDQLTALYPISCTATDIIIIKYSNITC